MAFFRVQEPVILKEGSDAKEQLATLESLRETVPRSQRRRLDSDIRALKAGIVGEDRILFELKNSHLPLVVIHDLHLEFEGLTAQIDFLVLTRRRNFVLECKNLYGDISVNARGDFVRSFGGKETRGDLLAHHAEPTTPWPDEADQPEHERGDHECPSLSAL